MLTFAICIFLIIIIIFVLGYSFCFIFPAILSLILCGGYKGEIKGGKNVIKTIENLDKIFKGLVKEYKNPKIKYSLLSKIENLKNYKKIPINDEEAHINFYLNEKYGINLFKNSIFKKLNLHENSKNFAKKWINNRILSDNYPLYSKESLDDKSIAKVIYKPKNDDFYKLKIKYLEYLADINFNEKTNKSEINKKTELENLINKFELGSLTENNKIVNFLDGSSIKTYDCVLSSNIKKNIKKLHWGQRKLLLSEIDFLNRIYLDLGKNTNKKISMIYPGSARGDHLIFLMELYPKLTIYLWDPAPFNTILYIIEFMRRNIPIKFKYSKYEKIIASKYKNRVFINMEMTNKEFLEYHENATNNKKYRNIEKKLGFFTEKSIKYLKSYRKKEMGVFAFVSDIRLYDNFKMVNFYYTNSIFDTSLISPSKFLMEKLINKEHKRDMNLQKEWFIDSKSDYGLFKFKIELPETYETDLHYNYIDGDILFQVWARKNSAETRLFVKPERKSNAYYNKYNYKKSINYFNSIMRQNTWEKITTEDLGITLDKNSTIENIWKEFIPKNKMGIDCILETHILYEYLSLFKKKITTSDIILLISDITQVLFNMEDHRNIKGYYKKINSNFILNKRKKYHNSFSKRLEINVLRDNIICNIK